MRAMSKHVVRHRMLVLEDLSIGCVSSEELETALDDGQGFDRLEAAETTRLRSEK